MSSSETSLGEKVRYVKAQEQTRDHNCHWPGCERQVPPAKWGCSPHWFKLPKDIRDAIWRAYRPGQEIDSRPSEAYLGAALRAQAWIAADQAATPPKPTRKKKVLTQLSLPL